MLLEYTGERVIPELMKPTNGLYLEHLARYYFSIPYVKGRVLDAACGTGYGTQLLAKASKKHTEEMIGIDIDKETVDYAGKRYNHPLITYIQKNVIDPKLRETLGQFDTIISFETIEHVEDDRLFMSNMYDMLRPGGKLVLSTPFGQGRGKPCGSPFHVHQLTVEEFKELFVPYSEASFYYQWGVAIETPREGINYPLGIAVAVK